MVMHQTSSTSHLEVGRLRLHYVEQGAGEPLLLLHGLGGSTVFWADVIPLLAARFRVLAPDLPGHGLSDKPDAPYDLAYGRSFVPRLMDALGLPAAHVVGHSTGGLLGMVLARDHPERVSTLTLVDSAGLGSGLHWTLRLASLPLFDRMLVRDTRFGMRLHLGTLFFDKRFAEGELLERLAEQRRLPGATRTIRRALRCAVSPAGQRPAIDQRPYLAAIRSPVLIVWGEQDALIPAAHAREAKRLRPEARLTLFPRCGHCPNVEYPQEFARVVTEFIQEVSS